MTDRIRLSDISPLSWEHPADRAALDTLRALPGLDEVVRKVLGVIGERGIRHLFLGNAMRVTLLQRPKLHELFSEVLETLDWQGPRPDLYVTQTPITNAGAIGLDQPFIVINTGTLHLLDREEQRNVLGHELGHIISGHAIYRTIALLLLTLGLRNIPLAGIAILPIEMALFEWFRKSELSCDRAGLLAGQQPRISLSTQMKLAGGSPSSHDHDDSLDVDEFIAQADRYELNESALDLVMKYLNTAFQTHPFHTVRAAELHRWVLSGEYDRILQGQYLRRSAQPSVTDAYSTAADYYKSQARDVWNQVGGMVKNARDAVNKHLKVREDDPKR
ncbi:MAG TPA: M48 family metallopeptidase [Thermoanaerobaculia bacterium]|nr:M48 family metallopeptidase [Thermoanaerobaculia bacterium]